MDETPLSGGGRTAVSRIGNVVLRQAGTWTPTIHSVLSHFETVGFHRAPRVIGSGFDSLGRETLSFIEGEFVHPSPWTDAAFPIIGQMLRQVHDATASFPIPENAIWQKWFGRDLGDTNNRVIGHCDTGPWNIVAQDGMPIALIDWEVAGPVDPIIELVQACWLNAQLVDDDIAGRVGLPPVQIRAQQARAILEGYGLAASQRAGFFSKLVEFAIRDAARQVIDANVTPDTTDATELWAVTWRTRSAAWMLRNRLIIENALT